MESYIKMMLEKAQSKLTYLREKNRSEHSIKLAEIDCGLWEGRLKECLPPLS